MTTRFALALAVGCCALAPASAGPLDKTLARLNPEFRSHQVCILRGLDAVRSDPLLRKADRMKTSIFGPALLEGARLTAKGGAVRAGRRWYALSFSCDLTSDLMKAISFSFTRGAEIPERDWDRLGLWG
jgi:hypothetical protein